MFLQSELLSLEPGIWLCANSRCIVKTVPKINCVSELCIESVLQGRPLRMCEVEGEGEDRRRCNQKGSNGRSSLCFLQHAHAGCSWKALSAIHFAPDQLSSAFVTSASSALHISVLVMYSILCLSNIGDVQSLSQLNTLLHRLQT